MPGSALGTLAVYIHGILREESVPLLGLTALLWLLGLGLNPPGCCRVDSEPQLGVGVGTGWEGSS